ncbi:EAL domain-containing protein [Altererythrobacter sp. ZODW24]|uniref:putative bifunctional diguanylate cyclase/phosphodiesterase n=1 Tax=Altererythrobacter sp. ZODW24 TaxID=2185142 RepID=UPI000DF78C79|nr:EAL domain-containing protein [Altererythrobacter sp. ZODW24]
MAVKSFMQGLTNRRSNSIEPTSDVQDMVIDSRLRHEILDEFEQASIGWIWATDAEGRLIYMSPNAAEKLGRSMSELVGETLMKLFETDTDNPDEKSDRPLNFQLKSRKKIRDLTVRFALNKSKHDVRQTWWSISGKATFDANGNFKGYRGSAYDITVEYEQKLVDSKLAEYDSLTGLANRHYMNKRLDGLIASYRTSKRSCALMMLDLDKFKRVNDTMGHQAGDSLLIQASERLRNIIGDRGEVGRLGGDEFQIILPDIDDRGTLGEIADKIIQIVSQPYPIEEKRAIIGTSVGIAIMPYDGIEREELIRASDLALYAAKNGGRGQFRFYSSDLKDEEEERDILIDDLRLALQNEDLELHYQPVVRATDNTVVCIEALMRWTHPERGFVSPGLFIPVAEDSDLINDLGEWALLRACTDALEWPKTVRVAVNVSAVQFANPAFPPIVERVVEESGLDPDRLELELTESIFVGDNETTAAIFTSLKALGVRLALDDFGTGYSSLSYLRNAPFDKLKVDRSFVETCTQTDENSAKIIAAIIGLSNALGMETTVEGVEAFDQLEVVKSKGGTLIQGWLYSKALPQPQILEKIGSGDFKIEPQGPDRHRPERRSVFRRVGVIHDDHRYEAVMRDLSKTGTLIEGLIGVPKDTQLVVDMGGGQLAVGVVTRVTDKAIGIEFENALVSDGAGGLCTRHRVSPYALAAAGMPLASLTQEKAFPHEQMGGGQKSEPAFMQVQISGAA